MSLNHSPAIVTDGLVLCLDAANVRSYPKSGTTWSDLAGSNDGALQNMEDNYSDENKGVLNFDGSNEYVSIAANGAGAAVADSDEFTVMTWVNLDTTVNQDIVEFGGPNNYALQLIATGGKFQVSAAGGGRSQNFTATDSFSTGVWYHVAGSIKAFGDAFLYVNGEEVSGAAGGSSPPVQSIQDFDQLSSRLIGMHAGGPGNFVNGKVAGVTLYSRQLSHKEVYQSYLATRGRFK